MITSICGECGAPAGKHYLYCSVVTSPSPDAIADINRAKELETTIATFLHDIDNHDEDQGGPITMTDGMWLQVEAFRKLLGRSR